MGAQQEVNPSGRLVWEPGDLEELPPGAPVPEPVISAPGWEPTEEELREMGPVATEALRQARRI